MPYYFSRIIIREIDCGYGFPAENLEEAKIRLHEQLDSEIEKNTVLCTVERENHDKV